MHSSALAGACAGLVSSVVTCPLDVVKTRLQAQEGRHRLPTPPISPPTSTPHAPISPSGQQYLGLTSTIKKIYQTDGIRGFYRGLGPTIFGYLPTWAIYFTVYDNSKMFLSSYMGVGAESSSSEFLNHIVSAMTAGAASTICTSPLWVVKTRFMLQSVKDKETVAYRHTGDAFLQIYRAEGLRGFYKGLLPSLFGVSHVAVQFPLYEAFKGWVRDAKASRSPTGASEDLVAGEILLCSSSAKMIASVTTYPHEVLRTRLQMQPRGNATTGRYTGVIQASKTIATQEGIRGFYKGMTVNLVRTVPSSALTILTYELIMQHLAHREQ